MVVCLGACGGGGDSSQSTPSRATFNADAAFTKALEGGVSLDGLRAVDRDGAVYTVSLSYGSLPDGSFLGLPARRSLQTSVLERIGVGAMKTTTIIYYETRPARVLGTLAADGKTTVFLRGGDLPTAATVGQSGPFSLGTAYASAALAEPVVGTETLDWSIEPDAGTTAFACLTSVSRSMGSVATEKDCFRIDADGNISGGRISIDRPGLSLNFQN
jgi:hypothetical protein